MKQLFQYVNLNELKSFRQNSVLGKSFSIYFVVVHHFSPLIAGAKIAFCRTQLVGMI